MAYIEIMDIVGFQGSATGTYDIGSWSGSTSSNFGPDGRGNVAVYAPAGYSYGDGFTVNSTDNYICVNQFERSKEPVGGGGIIVLRVPLGCTYTVIPYTFSPEDLKIYGAAATAFGTNSLLNKSTISQIARDASKDVYNFIYDDSDILKKIVSKYGNAAGVIVDDLTRIPISGDEITGDENEDYSFVPAESASPNIYIGSGYNYIVLAWSTTTPLCTMGFRINVNGLGSGSSSSKYEIGDIADYSEGTTTWKTLTTSPVSGKWKRGIKISSPAITAPDVDTNGSDDMYTISGSSDFGSSTTRTAGTAIVELYANSEPGCDGVALIASGYIRGHNLSTDTTIGNGGTTNSILNKGSISSNIAVMNSNYIYSYADKSSSVKAYVSGNRVRKVFAVHMPWIPEYNSTSTSGYSTRVGFLNDDTIIRWYPESGNYESGTTIGAYGMSNAPLSAYIMTKSVSNAAVSSWACHTVGDDHKYLSITTTSNTCNEYYSLTLSAHHRYTFRFHTYSESGDGVVVLGSTSSASFPNCGDGLFDGAKVSGLNANGEANYTPTSDKTIYVYFKCDNDFILGNVEGYYDDSGVYNEFIDSYSWADVEIIDNGIEAPVTYTGTTCLYLNNESTNGVIIEDDYVRGDRYYNKTYTGEETQTFTLPTPICNGYRFDGWYTSASGGSKVTSVTAYELSQNGTIYLYAHWTIIKIFEYTGITAVDFMNNDRSYPAPDGIPYPLDYRGQPVDGNAYMHSSNALKTLTINGKVITGGLVKTISIVLTRTDKETDDFTIKAASVYGPVAAVVPDSAYTDVGTIAGNDKPVVCSVGGYNFMIKPHWTGNCHTKRWLYDTVAPCSAKSLSEGSMPTRRDWSALSYSIAWDGLESDYSSLYNDNEIQDISDVLGGYSNWGNIYHVAGSDDNPRISVSLCDLTSGSYPDAFAFDQFNSMMRAGDSDIMNDFNNDSNFSTFHITMPYFQEGVRLIGKIDIFDGSTLLSDDTPTLTVGKTYTLRGQYRPVTYNGTSPSSANITIDTTGFNSTYYLTSPAISDISSYATITGNQLTINKLIDEDFGIAASKINGVDVSIYSVDLTCEKGSSSLTGSGNQTVKYNGTSSITILCTHCSVSTATSSNSNVVEVTIAGNTLNFKAKGNAGTSATITVTGTSSDSNNYNDPSSIKFTVSVIKAGQTAPVIQGASATYNSGASASVKTAGTAAGALTWENQSIAAGNVGSQTARAYYAATSNYEASEWSNSVTVSVGKYTPTVTLSATDRVYNGSALYATATVSSPTGGATPKGTIYYGTSAGATTYSVAYSGTAVSLSSVSVTKYNNGSGNSTTVYAYFIPDSSCNSVYNQSGNTSRKLTITGKADQTVPTASGASVTFHSTATASVTGGGQGSIEWALVSGTNDGGNLWQRSTVGTHKVKARWSGNSNYNASSYSSAVSLVVSAANDDGAELQAVTGTLTYNGSTQTLFTIKNAHGCTFYYACVYTEPGVTPNTTAAPTSWNTIDASSSDVALTNVQGTNAGKYTLWYKWTVNSSHTGNQDATCLGTVQIGKANQNAPTATGSTVWYGNTAEATATGGGNQGTLMWTNGNTRTAIGSQSTRAYYAGNTNYNASPYSNSVTLTVNIKDASASALNKTYTGGVQTGVTGSNVNWSGTTEATDASTYTAYATPNTYHYWSDGTNAQKTITWTIGPKSIVSSDITITLGSNPTYNESAQSVTVTVTDATRNVTLTSGTDYTYSGNSGTNAGDYTLTVTGKGNYNSTNTKGWRINKAPNPLSWSPAGKSCVFSDNGVAMTTASGQGTLSYTITSVKKESTDVTDGFALSDYTIYTNKLKLAQNRITNKSGHGDGISAYTQLKCQVTYTDTGYRIYRAPNLTYPGSGSVMWGGLVLDNTGNRFNLQKGHRYVIYFDVKGVSSNAARDVTWSNRVGWGGGGLTPSPVTNIIENPVTENFNSSEWRRFYYDFTINDDIYKKCTTSYSSFVAGNTYLSYAGFKFGFEYENTGANGTDIYINNIHLVDITCASAGSYTVSVKVKATGNSNYNAGETTGSFTLTIAKANQPSTATPVATGYTGFYDNLAHSATCAAWGGRGPLSWNTTNSRTEIGTTALKVRYDGDTNWYATPYSNEVSITINPGLFIKKDGEWKAVKEVYKKVNGSWVKQTVLTGLFSTTECYLGKNASNNSNLIG